MTGLLDINFLIALTWPSHFHHERAQSWFSKNAALGWATCPITQCGFVRASSNPSIIPDAVSPQSALAVLEELTSLKGHTFWTDQISCVSSESFPRSMLIGHRQVTDAYLFSLAIRKKGRLITFDKGIRSLIRARSRDDQFLLVLD